MTDYVENVSKTEDSDGTKFGQKYWIRSTGSDPHQNGQHALFFVNKEDQEGCEYDKRKKKGEIAYVYKPHDLSADNAVIGENGIFAGVNGLIRTNCENKCEELNMNLGENKDALATIQINSSCHIEEFVEKQETMEVPEARLYFFRAGILKAITDAMAIIDLHVENIMPTQKGPIIIDAEIDFFHYNVDSNLKDALSNDMNNDGQYSDQKRHL